MRYVKCEEFVKNSNHALRLARQLHVIECCTQPQHQHRTHVPIYPNPAHDQQPTRRSTATVLVQRSTSSERAYRRGIRVYQPLCLPA